LRILKTVIDWKFGKLDSTSGFASPQGCFTVYDVEDLTEIRGFKFKC
jgi:hypothetical protein